VDLKIFYNIHYEMPLGIPIALYFYLTGLSAGSFVISVISTLGGKTEYKRSEGSGRFWLPYCSSWPPSC